MLGYAHDDLPVVILPGPRRHHHVRRVVLVPRGDHHAGLWSGYEGMVGTEVGTGGDGVHGFVFCKCTNSWGNEQGDGFLPQSYKTTIFVTTVA